MFHSDPGDDDLKFAALAAAVWGPSLPNFRLSQLRLLSRVHTGVQPLAEWAQCTQSPSVHRVAVIKNAAFIAVLSALVNTIPPEPEIHEQIYMTNGYGKVCTTISTFSTSVSA